MLLSAPVLTSCQWFDVGNESEIDENDMFGNADGFYTALTGIYLNMCSTNLYGGNLSLTALEPLTQQYSVSENDPDRIEWMKFNYTTDYAQKTVGNIWLTMYNTIANANMLLDKMDGAKGMIEDDVVNVMRGETLGLRALMYFDLVRMFNDIYAVSPSSDNVPFKTDFGLSLGKKVTSEVLLDSISSHLRQSRKLLASDPIKTGMATQNRYLRYDRTQRMNYYAVTALLARVELYRANYKDAATYAQEVIENRMFRFIRPEEVLQTDAYGVELKSDRIFTPEMVFALYCENILTTSRSYYEGLSQDFAKSTNAYEDSDVRMAWFYKNPSANGKINMIRYQRSQRSQDADKYNDPLVPMLKISEMYLILAECNLMGATTKSTAVEYINEVKSHRCTSEVAKSASEETLWTELTHEYICDFKGEGQLFFYYKRRNMQSVDDGNSNGNSVTVPASAYVLPLPDYEKQFGYGK